MQAQEKMKYKHALFLNPYPYHSSTNVMKLFPPTGLEYVATSAKSAAEKVTLLDLRYEEYLSRIDNLNNFIARGVDIVGVGIGWDRQLPEIYQLLNQLPKHLSLIHISQPTRPY